MAEKKKKLPIKKTEYKKLVNDCLSLISDYKRFDCTFTIFKIDVLRLWA